MTDIKPIELSLEFKHQTILAILVTDGYVEPWIAKSLIENREDIDFDNLLPGDEITIVIPERIALEDGLI